MISLARTFCISLFILVCVPALSAQEVSVEVSYDSVYLGNVLQLKYTMDNWEGDLKSPDFGSFDLISGPNVSTSISISGGHRSSRKSMSFFLSPPESAGQYTIPSQEFTNGEEVILSDEKVILVLNNPDNIKQNPEIASKQSPFIHPTPSKRPPERGQRRKF